MVWCVVRTVCGVLQGFTRPKVLLLLPQRNLAFRAVLRLVRLAMRETRADSVAGKARFVEHFTDPEVSHVHACLGASADSVAGKARFVERFTDPEVSYVHFAPHLNLTPAPAPSPTLHEARVAARLRRAHA